MDKIKELTELKNLLDNGVINIDEFQTLKNEILSKSSDSYAENPSTNKKGTIALSYGGQYFLFDVKTEIYINGKFHSKQSTKNGFHIIIPIESNSITIKLGLMGMKSSIYELTALDISKNYIITFFYDKMWGRYSSNFNIT